MILLIAMITLWRFITRYLWTLMVTDFFTFFYLFFWYLGRVKHIIRLLRCYRDTVIWHGNISIHFCFTCPFSLLLASFFIRPWYVINHTIPIIILTHSIFNLFLNYLHATTRKLRWHIPGSLTRKRLIFRFYLFSPSVQICPQKLTTFQR